MQTTASSASTAPPSSFALAKIQPPQPRTHLVERPALERALGHALQHQRLALLLAPAGYGKTSALARQIRLLPPGTALAWVSADEDDQLQRFLVCLAAALEPFDLPWRMSPEALPVLAQGERGVRDVAGELVNALAGAEAPRGVIVLDDAHRLNDPRVFELLQALIERLPVQWGLVVASRLEPPLALARLRAMGELAEFRQHELRFDEHEVAALIASAGGDTASASALLERTDGWAAGLRLSLATRPSSRGQAPSQRHLFDYLAAEVLDDMPDTLRRFLLRTSVLPELSAARCAQVSGEPHAAQLLEEVERRGLFVSVMAGEADAPEGDDTPEPGGELTLRLHDLFRDFLEDRLQRDHLDELPGLLRRAAAQEPDLARAVGYLARAGDWTAATARLAQDAQRLLSLGDGATLEQLLSLFPAAEFERRPDLHLLRGLAAWPRFDWDTLLTAMQRAATGQAAAGRTRDAALTRIYACSGLHHAGRLAEATQELNALRQLTLDDAARAFLYFTCAWDAFANARGSDIAPMFSEMLHALERLPLPQLWQQFPIHCVFVGMPGMRPLLERFTHGAMRMVGDSPSQLRAGAMHLRAWMALADGRLDDAAQWVARADEDCHWLGHPRIVMTDNRLLRSLVHALRGDHAASLAAGRELIDDLRERSPLSHRRVHETEVLAVQARAAWIMQDAPTLRELDRALQQATNPHEWAAAPEHRALSQACIALLEERLDEAHTLLAPLATGTNRSLYYPTTQALLMLAHVQQRQGRLDAAAATLKPWLNEALQGHEPGAALLAGRTVLQGLANAAWANQLTPDEKAMLQQLASWLAPRPSSAAADASEPRRSRPDNTPSAAADNPWGSLSERELEVLERMAAGDSNKLIARRFDLSPHTVKRHVANILGKLEVDTRGQAAARFNQRGG